MHSSQWEKWFGGKKVLDQQSSPWFLHLTDYPEENIKQISLSSWLTLAPRYFCNTSTSFNNKLSWKVVQVFLSSFCFVCFVCCYFDFTVVWSWVQCKADQWSAHGKVWRATLLHIGWQFYWRFPFSWRGRSLVEMFQLPAAIIGGGSDGSVHSVHIVHYRPS